MAIQLRNGEFYGRRLHTRSVNGLVLADVRYPAGARLARHSHECAYFCLIRYGNYSEQYGRRERTCSPGSVVFHPPGERHAEMLRWGPVLSFNVEVPSDWLDRVSERSAPLDQPAAFHGGEVSALATRLFEQLGRAESETDVAIESLACEILAAFAAVRCRSERNPPEWLRIAHDFLCDSFRESLTLAGIAENAGVHPMHLATSFRRFYGCSVGEFLRRCRVAHVRKMLVESHASLSEVALDAGFTDQSHMTHLFRRAVGKTPGQYRAFIRYKTN